MDHRDETPTLSPSHSVGSDDGTRSRILPIWVPPVICGSRHDVVGGNIRKRALSTSSDKAVSDPEPDIAGVEDKAVKEATTKSGRYKIKFLFRGQPIKAYRLCDSQSESKSDSEPKSDSKSDPKSDSKSDPKSESKSESEDSSWAYTPYQGGQGESSRAGRGKGLMTRPKLKNFEKLFTPEPLKSLPNVFAIHCCALEKRKITEAIVKVRASLRSVSDQDLPPQDIISQVKAITAELERLYNLDAQVKFDLERLVSSVTQGGTSIVIPSCSVYCHIQKHLIAGFKLYCHEDCPELELIIGSAAADGFIIIPYTYL